MNFVGQLNNTCWITLKMQGMETTLYLHPIKYTFFFGSLKLYLTMQTVLV